MSDGGVTRLCRRLRRGKQVMSDRLRQLLLGGSARSTFQLRALFFRIKRTMKTL